MKMSIAVILATLIGLSAVAWAVTARQAQEGMAVPALPGLLRSGGHEEMSGDLMSDSTSMSGMGAPLFIGMWVTMMAAMMFPSVAPMVVIYARISKRRGQATVSSALFTGSYLIVWTMLGLAVYIAYRAILDAAPSLPPGPAALVGGGILVGAGLYQFTRFKAICLRHCRTPLDFLLHWRPGTRGAVRMGGEHGLYCLGCCWGLMAVLFVLGLMNLAWMGLIAAVIFVEKVAPFGEAMAKGVGAGLIALGAALALGPGLFAGNVLGS